MRETATKEVMGENILHEKWWERLRETTTKETNCLVHHIRMYYMRKGGRD